MYYFDYKIQTTGDVDITFNDVTVQFGDNYKQIELLTVNAERQVWPLTFTGMRNQLSEMLAALRNIGENIPFVWRNPLGELGIYAYTDLKIVPTASDSFTLTTTFKSSAPLARDIRFVQFPDIVKNYALYDDGPEPAVLQYYYYEPFGALDGVLITTSCTQIPSSVKTTSSILPYLSIYQTTYSSWSNPPYDPFDYRYPNDNSFAACGNAYEKDYWTKSITYQNGQPVYGDEPTGDNERYLQYQWALSIPDLYDVNNLTPRTEPLISATVMASDLIPLPTFPVAPARMYGETSMFFCTGITLNQLNAVCAFALNNITKVYEVCWFNDAGNPIFIRNLTYQTIEPEIINNVATGRNIVVDHNTILDDVSRPNSYLITDTFGYVRAPKGATKFRVTLTRSQFPSLDTDPPYYGLLTHLPHIHLDDSTFTFVASIPKHRVGLGSYGALTKVYDPLD